MCQDNARGPLPSTLMKQHGTPISQMGKLRFPQGLLTWLEIVQPVIQQVGQAWV